MTLTGHWNRAWERPNHIETRDGLLREEQKWEDALDHYAEVVGAYIEAGGNVSRSRRKWKLEKGKERDPSTEVNS